MTPGSGLNSRPVAKLDGSSPEGVSGSVGQRRDLDVLQVAARRVGLADGQALTRFPPGDAAAQLVGLAVLPAQDEQRRPRRPGETGGVQEQAAGAAGADYDRFGLREQ